MKSAVLVLLMHLLLCTDLFPASVLHAAPIPPLRGRVNDTAGMFSPSVRAEIERLLAAHEQETTNQVVVATIPSLEDEILEGYSIRLAEAWKIGQKGKDNGVILLCSKKDRKLRIEVGYGLEGKLTDLVCGRIIRYHIVPYFKAGRFDDGLRSGVKAILGTIKGEYGAVQSREPAVQPVRGLKYWAKKALAYLLVGIFSIVGIVVGGLIIYVIFNIAFFDQTGTGWAFFFIFSPLFVGGMLVPFLILMPGVFGSREAILFLLVPVAAAYIGLKIFFSAVKKGKRIAGKYVLDTSSSSGSSRSSSGSSSWSSSGSSYSSSGSSSGGFSGGGGSFGGGGASGSW